MLPPSPNGARHHRRGLIKVMAYWGEEAIVQMVPDKTDVAVFAIPNGGQLHLDDSAISACLSSGASCTPKQ